MLKPFCFGLIVGALLTGVLADVALAQRPFRMHEPFYRDESARRTFFDGFAVTAELSYRPPGTLSNFSSNVLTSMEAGQELPVSDVAISPPSRRLAWMFNIDYQLAPQFDVTAIIDATGGLSGDAAALSWIALKRYWHIDGTDYAIRLAFDPRPSADRTLGLRQIDLAGAVTSLLTRRVSMDLVGGFRRVNVGYERLVSADEPARQAALLENAHAVIHSDIVLTRASGREMHVMLRYNIHFDRAQSHVFISALYEAGDYEVLQQFLSEVFQGNLSEEPGDFRSQVVLLRTGIRLNRPSYQVAPFVSLPLLRTKQGDEDLVQEGHSQRMNLGVRLTLR